MALNGQKKTRIGHLLVDEMQELVRLMGHGVRELSPHDFRETYLCRLALVY